MYIALILMAIILSLTTPVDRAVPFFIFLMTFFGLLLIASMVGIILYLAETGIMPEEEYYDGISWVPLGVYNFSTLVFAGAIMFAVFLIPMILRPLDFLKNFMNYTMGLFSYLFMMPTFTNIMQIYAMCNLHDISWGNRPAQGTGVDAFSMQAKGQAQLTSDY